MHCPVSIFEMHRRNLLLTKYLHGFDSSRAPRGNKRRERGHQRDEDGDGAIRFWIDRRNFVEHTGEQAAGCCTKEKSGNTSDKGDAKPLRQEKREDLAAQRSQGKAHTNLTLPHAAQIVQGSIEPDADQRNGRGGEEGHQQGAQAALRRDVVDVLLQERNAVNGPIRFKLMNAAVDRLGDGHWIAVRAHQIIREGIACGESS